MSDGRVRRVIATGRVGDLPLEILRVIWQEVHRAGADARRALRRHITKISVVSAFLNEGWVWTTFDKSQLHEDLLRHWHFLGRSTWTPREMRYDDRLLRRDRIRPVRRSAWPWLNPHLLYFESENM